VGPSGLSVDWLTWSSQIVSLVLFFVFVFLCFVLPSVVGFVSRLFSSS
jgi:hypothetical protein